MIYNTAYYTSRKPNVEPLLVTMQTILTSPRKDDDISGELAELIGYEDIELVVEILNNRPLVVQEVRREILFARGDILIWRSLQLTPWMVVITRKILLHNRRERTSNTMVGVPDVSSLP